MILYSQIIKWLLVKSVAGIELNIAGQITPAWKIIGGYAYTDAEVTKDNTLQKEQL